jgi:NACalpha-BTF3-like transcription factor
MNHPDRCKKIEGMMKTLSSTQLEELFKILQKNKCDYTLNNNGIFLNLSWLDSSILDQIELFIHFCNESKKELDKYEQICRDLNEDLEIKREEGYVDPEEIEEEMVEQVLEQTNSIEAVKKMVPKISSSMKFYLLKKKFSKTFHHNSISHLKNRELFKESPLLKN